MEAKCRDTWETDFLPLALQETRSTTKPEDSFLNDMMGIDVFTGQDEFHTYAYGNPIPLDDPKRFNPIHWWDNHRTLFPSFHLSFDTCNTMLELRDCVRGKRGL